MVQLRLSRHRGPVVVAVTMVSVGAFASCGTSAGPATTHATSAEVSVAEDLRAAAQASYERWAGSVDDRQAAGVVGEYRLNGAYWECMNDLGYEGSWEDGLGPASADDGLAFTVWVMEPLNFSDGAIARATFQRAEEAWNNPPSWSETMMHDGNDCREQAKEAGREAGDDQLDRLHRNDENSFALKYAWQDALLEIGEVLGGGPDGYLACLDSKELPIFGGGSAKDMETLVAQAMPDAQEIPLLGQEPSVAWSQFLRLEQELSAADQACRAEHFDEAAAMLPGVVKRFEADHATEIAEAEAHWTSVREEAAQYGWQSGKKYSYGY